MDPIKGFMLYGVCAAIVAVIAAKKGLSWSAYLLIILPLGPAVAIILPLVTQGSASGPGVLALAFCVPLGALLVALLSKGPKPLGARIEPRERKSC
jgi:hypothetical protein